MTVERGFDVNRRIAIPSKILEKLNIDYMLDVMTIHIENSKIILEKKERNDTTIKEVRK